MPDNLITAILNVMVNVFFSFKLCFKNVKNGFLGVSKHQISKRNIKELPYSTS
jgi:hypothetical protein